MDLYDGLQMVLADVTGKQIAIGRKGFEGIDPPGTTYNGTQ
jgi:hypothetical protein